ncbi:hypothetical protein [Stenotrophomonas sp. NPDC077659]|uniref:hypothetical protein n=1 Tax=Stenotrophomonas sp. NPDC077659 TaxID=3390694 RepID=UPI003D08C9FD
MRSRTDRTAHRLLALKAAQMHLARAAAATQAQQGAAQRCEAEALRAQAEDTVAQAIPLPEPGLSRSALYDRLRTLAVARAHALELQQAAGDLDTQAAACEERAQASRQQARAHQRKQSKLDHWQQQQRRAQARRHHQRQYQHHLEDVSCRFPPPR